MPPRKRIVKKPQEVIEDVVPITEEEQEAEIAALRNKADADKATGRMYLDGLVVVCLLVFIRQLYRYTATPSPVPALLVVVTILQTLLVPLSLSPERIPIPALRQHMEAYHHLIVLAQLALFAGSFVLQLGKVAMAELVRSALPQLLAFSVEVQRRAERQNEVALNDLETLKYNLKGA